MNSTANKNHRLDVHASTISLRSPNPPLPGIVVGAMQPGAEGKGKSLTAEKMPEEREWNPLPLPCFERESEKETIMRRCVTFNSRG